jgi:predicted nucleic-acid-binding Zn-ribbon protein
MPLNPEQLYRFDAWCESKGVSTVCPACGSEEGWLVQEIIAAPVFAHRIVEAEKTVLMLPEACLNCAFVRFFAAKPLGFPG